MAKKTVGYVKLEWTCPNCGTRNPGPVKICSNCGGPQPEDVQFEQPVQEALITEDAEIAKAKAGPDIHCPYCGTRNPAGSATCSRCGGDLSEGTRRTTGRVVGAHRVETTPLPEVTCPSCGTANLATARQCKQCGAPLRKTKSTAQPQPEESKLNLRGCLIATVVIAAIIIIGAIILFNRREQTIGTVEALAWKRIVSIEALVPVTREDWRGNIPANTALGTCTSKLHHVAQEPVVGAQEVCGTPYTVDKGSGYAEVVQDCVYQVYQDWCQYTSQAWSVMEPVVAQGADGSPYWPVVQLAGNERESASQETYAVYFDTDGDSYTYATTDPNDFARFAVGSEWNLEISGLGKIVSLSPAS